MVEKLLCPKCGKYSYTSASELYSPCPYCGNVFSNLSFDRRAAKRFYWSAECRVFEEDDYNQEFFTANIQDISSSGMKIKYRGEGLSPKSMVNIHIMDMNLSIEAKIRWIETKNSSSAVAGLQFVAPILLPETIVKTNL